MTNQNIYSGSVTSYLENENKGLAKFNSYLIRTSQRG